jgi:hypothetical protein
MIQKPLTLSQLRNNCVYKAGPHIVTVHMIIPENNLILVHDFSDLMDRNQTFGSCPLDLDLFLMAFHEMPGCIDVFNPTQYYDDFDWMVYTGMRNEMSNVMPETPYM